MSDNLPPGTTPSDVDDAMAPPKTEKILGPVTVLADAEVPEHADRSEAIRALMNAIRKELSDTSHQVVDGDVEQRWLKEG